MDRGWTEVWPFSAFPLPLSLALCPPVHRRYQIPLNCQGIQSHLASCFAFLEQYPSNVVDVFEPVSVKQYASKPKNEGRWGSFLNVQ